MPLDFERLRLDTEKMTLLGIPVLVQEAIWNSDINSNGNWSITENEIELLSLYCKPGMIQNLQTLCLDKEDSCWYSKKIRSFKEYSRKYGHKNYMEFVETLLILLEKFSAVSFEVEDRYLQRKVLLTIAESLLNHFAWGVYFAYLAGGIRDGYSSTSLTPNTMTGIQESLLASARLYMTLFSQTTISMQSLLDSIRFAWIKIESLAFIRQIIEKGTSDESESYRKISFVDNDMQNAIYAMALKYQHKLAIDGVVVQLSSSLTAGALVHALISLEHPLAFYIAVYSNTEDHVKAGEWHEMNQRDLLKRLQRIPPLVRPNYAVSGQKLLIIDENDTKNIVEDLAHFYKTWGATILPSDVTI